MLMGFGVRALSGLGQACTTLAPDQIYQYATGAGFPCDVAAQMVAIAMKESAGQTCAHNAVPPDDSYGLWQINMLGKLKAPRLAQFGISDPSQLFDPATNAAAAYSLWGGSPNNLNIAWAINDGGVNQMRYNANLPAAQAVATAAGCAELGGSSDISSSGSGGGDSSSTTSDSSLFDLSSLDPSSLLSNAMGGDPVSIAIVAGTALIGAWLLFGRKK